MIKNLPPNMLDFYVELIQEFWRDEKIDFDSWQAKVSSIIIANRLLQRLKQIRTNNQFGHIRCQEAQHILKRALLLRCQHGLKSYVLFVDLVKAFDSVHQGLLYAILERYGLPPPIAQKVAKLCKNCTVKIKVGRAFAEVDYTTGIHQDNMSPVLFPFVIQAFLDTVQLKAQPVTFAYFPKNKKIKTAS